MKDAVLWRKISRIIKLISDAENIDPETALDKFYNSRVGQLLQSPTSGLQQMSDQYILTEYLANQAEGND